MRRRFCPCPRCGVALAHRRLAAAREPTPSSHAARPRTPPSACPACGAVLRRSRAFLPVVLTIVAGYFFAKLVLVDWLGPFDSQALLTYRLACLGGATLALYVAHLTIGYRVVEPTT
jgi:hypothetical protein